LWNWAHLRALGPGGETLIVGTAFSLSMVISSIRDDFYGLLGFIGFLNAPLPLSGLCWKKED
jgi:hypothetical protein